MSAAKKMHSWARLLSLGTICLAISTGTCCRAAQKTTIPSLQFPGEKDGQFAKTSLSMQAKAQTKKAASQESDRKPALAAANKAASLPIAAPITLLDTSGRKRSLSEFRGRSVALFFFCGCDRCLACAKSWRQIQRGDVLPRDVKNSAKTPITLIVFTGDTDAARLFAAQTGLDKQQTVLLPDEKMEAARRYRAMTCPRIYVIDSAGRTRYTNSHADDATLKAPVSLIVSRTVEALKKCNGTR